MNLNLSSILLLIACILMFLEGFRVPSKVSWWGLSLAFVLVWLLVA